MTITDIMNQFGAEPAAAKTLPPQQYVVAEIQNAVGGACRRMFVLGPPRSRRLAAVRQAFTSLHIKPVVIDLGPVRLRRDLDAACRRAALGGGFFDAMIKLERLVQRLATRRHLAVIFHNFDGCFGSPGEDSVIDLVWMEAKNRCRGCKVIFTASNPAFVERCIRQFQNCRGVVREIIFPMSGQGNATSGQGRLR